MERLKERFPAQADFRPRESAERDVRQFGIHIRGINQEFTPVTYGEIKKYRDEAYPQWLEHCEEVLRNYHRTLQGQAPVLRFVFLAENRGTRPAADALITIEAQGTFQIKPPAWGEDDSGDEGEGLKKKRTALLPSPPSAPRGRWQFFGFTGTLHRSLAGITEVTASHWNPCSC